MSKLEFSGPATLSGFPRDKSFGFELDGENRLLIKAGKEVFLVVEKEKAPVVEALPEVLTAPKEPVVTEVTAAPSAPAATEDEKPKRTRAPNFSVDPGSIIQVHPAALTAENPFKKLRAQWFDTLKTANGRTYAWWFNSSMVKNLEGSPTTFIRFFLDEKVIQLLPPPEGVTAGPALPEAAPSGSGPTAGPAWAAQFAAPSGSGPTFM